MPVKRRASKRRADPVAEARAWSVAFHARWDFTGDLEALGVRDQPAIDAAMPDAWRRLGALFLEHDMGAGLGGECYALTEFGEPPCW